MAHRWRDWVVAIYYSYKQLANDQCSFKPGDSIKLVPVAILNRIEFKGEIWKRLRGGLQKNLFPPAEAESYMPLVSHVVEEGVANLKRNQHQLDKYMPTY